LQNLDLGRGGGLLAVARMEVLELGLLEYGLKYCQGESERRGEEKVCVVAMIGGARRWSGITVGGREEERKKRSEDCGLNGDPYITRQEYII